MADQKKNRKKVLVASCILAALIVGSSSFAWFTSQDEVTNRLTANSNYGVSITESFTPPTSWVPGQEINKDVGAVNTGNVDAFVKLTVSNELILKHEIASATAFDASKAIELSHKAATTTDSAGITTTVADEVTAIQAGSVLAYTNVDADKSKIGNIVVDNTLDENGEPTTVTGEFTPSGTGVYVFRRDIKNESSTSEFTYQGYYYDGSKYYAINIADESIGETVDKDGIFKADKAPTITYRQQETIVATPTLAYDSANKKITATYNNGTTDVDTDDVVIFINLADDVTTNWTNETGSTNFYLNKILKSGQTSADLIDSVTLSGNTEKGAYISLDYDLKIALDSAQVTYDKDGNVTSDAISAWVYAPTVTTGTTLTWAAP